MASIETGVDRLVKLIGKEKKIELNAAAKELNVAPAVVQEWADFLDQEGLIDLQYSLSKTFLVEKHLSKSDVEKKEKEYDSKREAFTRKVDTTLKQLENETADFESIKKQYYALKDQIGDEIDAVKEEIEQLRHYEELKKSIDSDILKQKVDYQKTLDEVHVRIVSEEKRYQKILEEIGEETAKLKAERSEFGDIKREEEDLNKRIQALQDILNSIGKRMQGQSQTVEMHEERLMKLRELAEKLQAELSEKKAREIDPMLKVSKDQEARILRIQDEIVEKVKQRRDAMQNFQDQSEEVTKRFATFFERRAKTEETIKQLEKSKAEMKEELNGLVRKAKAFDLASKNSDTNAHIKELEGKFKEFDQKKSSFAEQLEKLKGIIMGKEDKRQAAPAAQRPAVKAEKPKRSKAVDEKAVKRPVKQKPVKPKIRPTKQKAKPKAKPKPAKR